jgi:uncharacterized protein (TIGR02145 family)
MKIYLISSIMLLLAFSAAAQEGNTQTPANTPATETITDVDGNVYPTVQIGNQVWMKENLRTTRYRNGDPIPTTNPPARNISDELITDPLAASDYSQPSSPNPKQPENKLPKYQWAYDGKEENAAIYGRLYTWYAAADERGICPEGWHLPTDADWGKITALRGGNVTAGGQLKETGTEFWAEPNAGATNESGFSARGAGGKNLDGSFSGMGKYVSWWTATPSSCRHIEHDEPYTFRNYYYSSPLYGFSVRCVKD